MSPFIVSPVSPTGSAPDVVNQPQPYNIMKSVMFKALAYSLGAPVITTGTAVRVTGTAVRKVGEVIEGAGAKTEAAGSRFQQRQLAKAASAKLASDLRKIQKAGIDPAAVMAAAAAAMPAMQDLDFEALRDANLAEV